MSSSAEPVVQTVSFDHKFFSTVTEPVFRVSEQSGDAGLPYLGRDVDRFAQEHAPMAAGLHALPREANLLLDLAVDEDVVVEAGGVLERGLGRARSGREAGEPVPRRAHDHRPVAA